MTIEQAEGEYASRQGDTADRDYAIEQRAIELYQNNSDLADQLVSFFTYIPRGKNDPRMVEALIALRVSDYTRFGELVDAAMAQYTWEQAQQDLEAAEDV